MDAVRAALLRDLLAGTEWPQAVRHFAGSLRASLRAPAGPGGSELLLVGTADYEPWHLAAHLDDEAAWSGLPELSPTLVRHRVPDPAAPPHLSVGLGRLHAARRGATLLVVAPEEPGAELLERVEDARRAGATVLALDGGHADLHALAHDALAAPAATGLDLDTVQHLVSVSAGEDGLPAGRSGCGPADGRRRCFKDRLARLADRLTEPPPARW
jgi:hypothetical protein